MVHSHTVHLALGALLSPCTMCGTGAYGCDSGSYKINDSAERPGCASKWCDPDTPWQTYAEESYGRLTYDPLMRGPCGFQPVSPGTWRPEDLKTMLELHNQFGKRYRKPRWHAGCTCALPARSQTDSPWDSPCPIHGPI